MRTRGPSLATELLAEAAMRGRDNGKATHEVLVLTVRESGGEKACVYVCRGIGGCCIKGTNDLHRGQE